MYKKFILSPLLFLFISFSSAGQKPNDPISFNGLNEKFLEHLIKEKIDEVRINHNLLPLANDSILFIASKFHASYLSKKGQLSHYEPENPEMETPQKRVNYFKAINYYVGENVAQTSINVHMKDKKGHVFTNETYEQVATDFVTMWVNSPGHYKNIITADYNATGLSVWADTKTHIIYAVQKFATVLFKYKFVENKSLFPYSNYISPSVINSFQNASSFLHKGKHAFNLKNPKKESYLKYELAKPDFAFGLTSIEVVNNSIYLSSFSYRAILNILRKRKDGFAAEIVRYQPEDCGNPEYYTKPSRRNNQCLFSGRVLKPVYKKDALKAFKPGGKKRKQILEKIEKGKTKKYMLKLGKLPKNISGYAEINLVVIQKKRVVDIKRFSAFCGDTLEKFYHLPFYEDSVYNNSELTEYYQNTSFSIPFQKGKTEYKLTDIKPITDSLLSESFSADTITIKAYSSVEGIESINKQLQEQRAKNIVSLISQQQNEKLNTQISVEENWALFESQIEKNKDLFQYKDLSHEQIKEKLTDTSEQRRVEDFLSKQRVAHIWIHAKQIVNDQNVEKYISKKIKPLKSQALKFSKTETKLHVVFNQFIDSLKLYMEVAYNNIQSGIIKPEFFAEFNLSDGELFNNYNLLKLKYWIQIQKNSKYERAWVKKVYGDLVNMYNKNASSFFINFNMLNLIQTYGKDLGVSISDDQRDKYIYELRLLQTNEKEKEMVDKLAINFWFSVCKLPEYQQQKNSIPLYRKCMQGIHDYFVHRELSTEDLNKLAKFYIFQCRADWAYEILWPEFEQTKNNPEGLILLSKLLYQNYEETSNADYYEFLIKVYDRIGKAAWCPMFIGPCNISFQALDYEYFRNFYCSKCSDYLNYAKTPKLVK
jgi:uncharacterized protein YkwD